MDTLRRLATPVLVIALALIIIPLADLVGNVWPVRLGAEDWRYGAVGILSNFLLTPLLGLLLVALVAYATERAWLLRTIGIKGLIAAGALVIIIGGFTLDAIQVRQTRPYEDRWITVVSYALAAAKLGIGAVCLAVLGVGSLRAARDHGKRDRKDAPTVVVGRS